MGEKSGGHIVTINNVLFFVCLLFKSVMMMRNSIIEMSAALGFFLTTDKNVFVIKMFFLYLAIHKANNRLISTWYFFFI